MSRLLALIVLAATAVPVAATTAPTPAAAQPLPGHVQVVNHDNVHTLAALTQQHRTVTSARRAVAAERADMPPELRDLIHLTTIRAGRFTVSVAGDQGCVRAPRAQAPNRVTVTAGPCTAADRRPTMALRDAARVVGRVLASDLRAGAPDATRDILSAENLAYVASRFAPRGVRITGITDVNADAIDDDARIAFRTGRRVVCLQLPLTQRREPRIFPAGCRHLPPRNVARELQATERP